MLTPGPSRTSFFLYRASSPKLTPYSLDKSVLKVTKPTITPITVNREDQSEFLTDLLAEETKDIEPVFIDFENYVLFRVQ